VLQKTASNTECLLICEGKTTIDSPNPAADARKNRSRNQSNARGVLPNADFPKTIFTLFYTSIYVPRIFRQCRIFDTNTQVGPFVEGRPFSKHPETRFQTMTKTKIRNFAVSLPIHSAGLPLCRRATRDHFALNRQNKPNFSNTKTNLTSYGDMDYEQKPSFHAPAKQTQFPHRRSQFIPTCRRHAANQTCFRLFESDKKCEKNARFAVFW